jgi:hypothetical protein
VSSSGGLQEGLEQQDRELGLSPSGGVVSALYQAALSESPRVGSAMFEVTISQTGNVQIALTGARGDGSQWQAVLRRAGKSLREKPPRIPRARKGMRVVVKILTEEIFPSGKRVKERGGMGTLLPTLGDLVDIGVKPQKIIRTRVQEETMF